MITGRNRFNIYLLLTLATAMALRLPHAQTRQGQRARHVPRASRGQCGISLAHSKAHIYRASPVEMDIEKDPFLTEAHVATARVVEVPGGFDLQDSTQSRGHLAAAGIFRQQSWQALRYLQPIRRKRKRYRAGLPLRNSGNVMSDGHHPVHPGRHHAKKPTKLPSA